MLRIWFRLKKDENDEMAKRRKTKGRSVKNGNAPSPYMKYNKKEYDYGEGYKKNTLIHGILCRDGKPYTGSVSSRTMLKQAAE